jgi:NAD+ kinase
MRSIALFAFPQRQHAVAGAASAAARLLAEGVEVLVTNELAEALPPEIATRCEVMAASEFERSADMVISFGGDGTLLAVARLLIGTDTPIMGVNVGKLGFLAEFPVTALAEALDDVIKGTYRLVDRTTLCTTVNGVVTHALNEFVVEKSTEARMIAIRAYVNEHHVADYRADGILVTTPTGSTAYSLAAGGPIIAPSSRVIGLTPISPHTLTLRPLIVQDNSEIRLELPFADTAANLVADGQIVTTLAAGDSVIIRSGENMVKLVKRANSTYYDLLREKLLWSVDATRRT